MAKYYKRAEIIEATIDKDAKEVKKLIDSGADVNVQDKYGWTALHFAAQNRDVEIGRMLLENGATVDVRESYGNTALSNAVFSSKGDGDMINLLLEYGAGKNQKNNYDVSPYELAHEIANYNVAQFLD
jgi:ankyrin repeat protein